VGADAAGASGDGGAIDPTRRRRPIGSRTWPRVALIALLAVIPVRLFVAEPVRIPSSSMRPTVVAGEHVLVDKLTYRLRVPRRWELVVFDLPGGELGLKRVVGLPGDRVALRDGALVVDGRRVEENYVDYESVDATFFGPVTVPRGHLFVMGDRRANSEDSRDFGPVPLADVVGQAVLVVWPPENVGRL
jgi:signal peptidase I